MARNELSCVVLEVGETRLAVVRRGVQMRADDGLTAAELVVLRGIFAGKSNGEIARDRGTSPRTIANQVASIFRKHGVRSRSELVARYFAVAS